jgi:hypothetical protein
MDIAEGSRYDVRVGAKHDVGIRRDCSDARLEWIELRVEIPNDLLSVIVNREACEPVQVKYARHQDK